MAKSKPAPQPNTTKPKVTPNPLYPSTTGNPPGKGRGNTPKK